MKLTSNQIQEIIPHRYPLLLVDTIQELEPGVKAMGTKCVTVNEHFFLGHFPQEHVMPGVLMIEALAQVGAVAILALDQHKGKNAYFAGINKARFKRKVIPGDCLELSIEIVRQKGAIGIGKGMATVKGELAVEAELMFAIQ